MPLPVICFDLDGTLVDEGGFIHPRDVEILNAEPQAAVFIPCTGRLRPAVRKLFWEHGIRPGVALPFPLALQNGGALYGPREELLSMACFAPRGQESLVALVQAASDVTFLIFSESQVYIQWPDDFSLALVRRFDLEVAPFRPQDGISISKAMALSADRARLESVCEQLRSAEIDLSYSLDTVVEITPAGVDKGRGIGNLLRMLDLQDRRILVAGDGGNDFPLFAITADSFAPLSAPASVRARARRVIDTTQSGLLAPMLAQAGILLG